ncbi:hypothetical protein [Deinococcus hohokamensis]|uniref:Uncharacterized protein n=1 Tax=Deinococcus hohokamensis TaxID=309883 RepID=A0ABV9I6L5_9DEIO
MTEWDQAQLVGQLREEARRGASGTEIARGLKARYGTAIVTVGRQIMDAFGMGLRDARSWEMILASDHGGPIELLDADWAPYLGQPDLWPKRIVRLEIQETPEEQFVVTLRLFEYHNAQQREAVLVDWGDGTQSETQTSDLPLSHRYTAPGRYAFFWEIPGVGWALKRVLVLEVKSVHGTTSSSYQNPW